MDIFNPTPNLDKVLEDIGRLQEAYNILKELYMAKNAYLLEIREEDNIRMQNFFGFDDSE